MRKIKIYIFVTILIMTADAKNKWIIKWTYSINHWYIYN